MTFIRITRIETDNATYSFRVENRLEADRLLLPENRAEFLALVEEKENDLELEAEERISVEDWRYVSVDNDPDIPLTEPEPALTDSVCPGCGSENIVGSSYDNDWPGLVMQECSCNDCEAEWILRYQLIEVETAS